jgi:hypothetical protein
MPQFATPCLALLVLALAAVGTPAGAQGYPECRMRCDTDYTDCSNEAPAPDPETVEARRASCERKLRICIAECDYLKPAEPAQPEMSPNIIIEPR